MTKSVTDLPVKTSVLKKVAKRGVIAAVAVGAVALAIRLKAQSDEDNATNQA